MRFRLYQKLLGWLFLHLVLLVALATALVGGILLKGSDGLLPGYFFSSNIENVFRTISAHCQYTSVRQWDEILEQYNRAPSLTYYIYPLDDPSYPLPAPIVPAKLAAAAARLPRHPFTLCPDPAIVLPDHFTTDDIFLDPSSEGSFFGTSAGEPQGSEVAQVDTQGLDAGIPLTPKSLFMRTSSPRRYWLGMPVFIPDENNKLHYVLLTAASDSIFGHGLYFDIHFVLGVLGAGLLISCLWWWPFVRHITRPLVRMENVSAKIVADDPKMLSELLANNNLCQVDPERTDEIGRLALSINAMARQMHSTLVQQRRFISHIAHEINSPLARVQIGLALMEERTKGKTREKMERVLGEVERLSGLTVDILTFLREESEPHPVIFEPVALHDFLSELVELEIPPDRKVILSVPEDLSAHCPRRYLQRAIHTIFRNIPESVLYDGCLEIGATTEFEDLRITIAIKDPDCSGCIGRAAVKPFFEHHFAVGSGSTGPGLSIVDYCINVCKGSVLFFNDDPAGRIAEIYLPLHV